MRRALRTRARIKRKIVTPGGRTVIHIKKKKPSYAKCGICGAKLNRAKLDPTQLKKLPKVQHRPERPLPHLCPSCMREEMKKMVRG